MEREEKCISFLVLESDFGRKLSHLPEKEKRVLSLSPSLGSERYGSNGSERYSSGQSLLVKGSFWLLVENVLLKRSKPKAKIFWV